MNDFGQDVGTVTNEFGALTGIGEEKSLAGRFIQPYLVLPRPSGRLDTAPKVVVGTPESWLESWNLLFGQSVLLSPLVPDRARPASDLWTAAEGFKWAFEPFTAGQATLVSVIQLYGSGIWVLGGPAVASRSPREEFLRAVDQVLVEDLAIFRGLG